MQTDMEPSPNGEGFLFGASRGLVYSRVLPDTARAATAGAFRPFVFHPFLFYRTPTLGSGSHVRFASSPWP